jgi:hypothetical protein
MYKFIALTLCLVTASVAGQTYEKKWNAGIHGGFNQYNGDMRNDFYKFDQPFYGHVGLSASRYLTRHWDAVIFATRGEMGHFIRKQADDPTRNSFLLKLTTVSLYARYHILSREARIDPYAFAGGGMLWQRNKGNDIPAGARKRDLALPTAGAGLNFRLNPVITLQFQETFMFTTADYVDFVSAGRNDWYLLHTVGITFNFGGKRCNTGNGVGDRIDRCSDVSRRSKK